MAQHIYTRTGDSGETGLFSGDRVPKNDPRVEACGDVDELNAALGIARSEAFDPDTKALIARLQSESLALGADLGAPMDSAHTRGAVTIRRVRAETIEAIEREIDVLEAELPPLTRFVLPGGTRLAAALHVARAVCRRAERHAVALARADAVNRQCLRYLNRLSDLLFVMARTANQRAGEPDVLWEP